jgi:hypothetical protein
VGSPDADLGVGRRGLIPVLARVRQPQTGITLRAQYTEQEPAGQPGSEWFTPVILATWEAEVRRIAV